MFKLIKNYFNSSTQPEEQTEEQTEEDTENGQPLININFLLVLYADIRGGLSGAFALGEGGL